MSETKIICPGCGAELAPGQAFCGNCGTKYVAPEPVPAAPQSYNCANCGSELAPGQAFCGTCGTPAMPAAPAPAAPVIPICANCGTELAEGQAFCPVCGTKATATMAPGVSGAIDQFNANVETKKKKKPIVPIVIGAVAVVIVLVLIISLAGGGKKDFNKMFSDIKYNSWCTIASDGSYMKIDTNPNDEDDYIDLTAYYTLESINAELGFPSSTYEKMGETRALDGRQYDSAGDVEVSWTYHPDSGLEVMYEWKD